MEYDINFEGETTSKKPFLFFKRDGKYYNGLKIPLLNTKNDKDFKAENLARYNDIIKTRVAKMPIDKLVKDAIDAARSDKQPFIIG